MQLSDTKSLDRKQTLLHYIAHVVETVYPNVLSFYDDLDIEEACQGIHGYTGDCAVCISISAVLMVICSINANDVRGCQELEEGAGGVKVREREGAGQLCHFHILLYVQPARENYVYS